MILVFNYFCKFHFFVNIIFLMQMSYNGKSNLRHIVYKIFNTILTSTISSTQNFRSYSKIFYIIVYTGHVIIFVFTRIIHVKTLEIGMSIIKCFKRIFKYSFVKKSYIYLSSFVLV